MIAAIKEGGAELAKEDVKGNVLTREEERMLGRRDAGDQVFCEV